MWNNSVISGPITITEQTKKGGIVTGYHLNIAIDLVTEELVQFMTEPETPREVFAGHTFENPITAFLVFESEAQAKEYLPEYWLEEVS